MKFFPQFLFSMAYWNTPKRFDVVRAMADKTDVLLDSGAYTAYIAKRKKLSGKDTSQFDITLDKVIEWYGDLKDVVWQYIQLDVIKDKENTRKNLYKMLDAGLTPMPVWLENDEDTKLLDKILQINPYLCVAGGGRKSAEYAYEWVPARNLVFYAIALSYAEAHRYDVIALGNNLEEAGAYPDNEMIFTNLFRDLVPYSINLDRQIEIDMPVGNLMKYEIVKWGIEMGAPLDLTWSCYQAGDTHCGECGPCYMRKKGFSMNGIEEVIEYAK